MCCRVLRDTHGDHFNLLAGAGGQLGGRFAASELRILLTPDWIFALATGVRLRVPETDGRLPKPREYQFGIRQLMIFTAIVAVIFGLGRWLVPHIGSGTAGSPDLPIFVFLAVAFIVMTLPLLLVGLLPRFALQAVLVVLLLVATACELSLINTLGVQFIPQPPLMNVYKMSSCRTEAFLRSNP